LRRGHEFRPPPVRDADEQEFRVEHEAEELDAAHEVHVQLVRRQHPAEGADDVQDFLHAHQVALPAHTAAKVVHVHDERGHEATGANGLGRDRREKAEHARAGGEAERKHVVDVRHALEAEPDQGAVPRSNFDVVVRALHVHRKELVHVRQLLDEVLEAFHLKRPLVQQLVEVAAVVDEAKLARAPGLRFDDERHDDLGSLARAAARGHVLVPR
jgi:hypothetical protein